MMSCGETKTIQNFWALYNNTLTQNNLLGYYNDYLIKTDFYFNPANGFGDFNIDLKQNKYYINSIEYSEAVPEELLNVSGTYVWNGFSWYCSETGFYITRHAIGNGGGFCIVSKEANPDTNNYSDQLRTQDDGFYSWNVMPGSDDSNVIYNYYSEPVCTVNTRKK